MLNDHLLRYHLRKTSTIRRVVHLLYFLVRAFYHPKQKTTHKSPKNQFFPVYKIINNLTALILSTAQSPQTTDSISSLFLSTLSLLLLWSAITKRANVVMPWTTPPPPPQTPNSRKAAYPIHHAIISTRARNNITAHIYLVKRQDVPSVTAMTCEFVKFIG